MSLLSLPNELLLVVTDGLHLKQLCRLSRTCRRLCSLLAPLITTSLLQKKDAMLRWAVVRGNEPIVRFLLENGTDVNRRWGGDLSPKDVVEAMKNNHESIIKLLFAHGLDVSTIVGPPKTFCLHHAITCVDDSTFQLFIDAGADVNYKSPTHEGLTPLQAAARSGQSSKVKVLIENGANIYAQTGAPGFTALHLAARYGHLETVEILLKRGCDVDMLSSRGWTALYYVNHGRIPMINLLLQRGADVNARGSAWSSTCTTPLHWMARTGKGDAAKLLLENGAKITAVDRFRRTPLHIAVIHKEQEIAKLFLKKGAKINARDGSGFTALHYATMAGSEALFTLLIKNEADIMVKNGDSQTALYPAADSGFYKAARTLLEKGVDIAARDSLGRTVLHMLANSRRAPNVNLGFNEWLASNCGRTASLFLSWGVDVSMRDEGGETALDVAVSRRWVTLERLLRDHEAGVVVDSRPPAYEP